MYTDEELEEKRLTYLRLCKPKELRRLRKEGALAEHLERRARRCRDQVASLTQDGVFEGRAWQVAIREALLETEAD